MNCPICEYRRIAREALDALADVLLDLGLAEKNGQPPYTERLAKLSEEFRTAYREEHPMAEEIEAEVEENGRQQAEYNRLYR